MAQRGFQEKEERDVFLRFAEEAGLHFEPYSIRQEGPPQPDILCQIEGGGWTGFELVRLTNEEFNKQGDLHYRLGKRLKREASRRHDFERRFCDAHIVLIFKSKKESGQRFISPALDLLLEMSDRFKGCVLTQARHTSQGRKLLEKLGSSVKELSVERLDRGNGPIFYTRDMEEVDQTRIVKRVQEKFGKTYDTTNAQVIELLAYFPPWHPAPGYDDWISALNDFVSSNLIESPFRKVWIFEDATGRILYSSREAT